MLKYLIPGIFISFAFNTFYAQQQKNVIIFLSDDQGYCELGSFMDFADINTLQPKDTSSFNDLLEDPEGKSVIQDCFDAVKKASPNLDKIANKGVRFINFCAAPTCGPSRAALMTSQYPQSFGVYANRELSKLGVPSDLIFPVKAFANAGYKTGIIGKWHLGTGEGQHPNDRGFDYYFGYDRAHTDKYNSPHLYINKEKAEAKGWLCDQITDEALRFIERSALDDKPFFLFVSFSEPKPPLGYPPDEYMNAINSGSKVLDAHFGSIYGMDAGVGKILQKIESIGADDKTMIMFASDNGLNRGVYSGDPDYRDHPDAQRVPLPGNGPLRGCKWTTWDGGIRTPMFAYIPGGKSGESDRLMSIMDFMPTALDYTDIIISSDAGLDGKSFLPVLKNDISKEQDDRILFWAAMDGIPLGGRGLKDFDKVEDQFFSMKPRTQDDYFCSWYVKKNNWKLIGWNGERPYLFDISSDPGEKDDLSGKYPELAEEMHAEFIKWMNDNKKPLVTKEVIWARLFNHFSYK